MATPTVDFELLRQIAEAASGLRDQDLWFVISAVDTPEGVETTFTWTNTPPNLGPDDVVIYCQATPNDAPVVTYAQVGANSTPIDLLTLEPSGYPPNPLGGPYQADAVFWSLSAVEKFLVPYYASVYGNDAPEYVKAVLDVLYNPGEMQAYAVTHLPSSEWVTLERDGRTIGGGLQLRQSVGAGSPLPYVPGVAMLLRDGTVQAVPVSARAEPGASAATNGSRSRYSRMAGR